MPHYCETGYLQCGRHMTAVLPKQRCYQCALTLPRTMPQARCFQIYPQTLHPRMVAIKFTNCRLYSTRVAKLQLTSQILQFTGSRDCYHLVNKTRVAMLYGTTFRVLTKRPLVRGSMFHCNVQRFKQRVLFSLHKNVLQLSDIATWSFHSNRIFGKHNCWASGSP